MSRYIDADALINRFDELCDSVCQYSKKQREVMCGACPLGSAFDVVDEFPTADVVEVVRCEDCKNNPKTTWFGCPMASHDYEFKDGFCYKGERGKYEIH